MSEASEEDKSTVVTNIRENVKENIRIARLKNRQDELDNLRITLGDVEDQSVNLQTFNPNDVLEIIIKIKRQRHASATELLKLSHAFLQSAENINCFVNTAGALPVIVKELTGTKIESQMLATECLCNLSLGPEISCEKVAQKIGTYLHTFLQSSNESIVRTSLWCLTNLIVAGKRPLNVLSSQELIKGLINVTHSSHSQNVRDESYVAIELILDHGGIPRTSDIETLSKWILDQSVPLNHSIAKIAYKLLNLLDFKSNDTIGIQKLVHICFDTLLHLHDNTSSSADHVESLHNVIILMRICSNIVALEYSFADYIIENWFESKNSSFALFFNHFIDQFNASSLSVEEIYWFIGNIMKCQLGETSLKYIEKDEFFIKIEMNA